MRVSLELRALMCEREHPQDGNLNCRDQRGEEIVSVLQEGFFLFPQQARVATFSLSSCVSKKRKAQKQVKLKCFAVFYSTREALSQYRVTSAEFG